MHHVIVALQKLFVGIKSSCQILHQSFRAQTVSLLTLAFAPPDGANDDQHKEATHNRINQDESAVQKICRLISDHMVNPFVIEDGANPENRQPLVNIATSIATPNNVAIFLCQASKRMVQKK